MVVSGGGDHSGPPYLYELEISATDGDSLLPCRSHPVLCLHPLHADSDVEIDILRDQYPKFNSSREMHYIKAL